MWAPVSFPDNWQGLRQSQKTLQQDKGLRLPRVQWHQEISRNNLSRNGAKAFAAIFKHLSNESDKTFQGAISGEARIHTKSDWDIYQAYSFNLGNDGWKVEHKTERAPEESVIDYIRSRYWHEVMRKALFSGNLEKALLCKARNDLHFMRSADTRDEAFARDIAEEFDPTKGIIHLCTRGEGHSIKFLEMLRKRKIPFHAQSSRDELRDARIREPEEWGALLKQKTAT